MYGRIVPVLIDAGATLGPAIAQYDMSEDGMRLIAGFEYAGDVPSGLEDVVLPEVATAFCGVHLGAMDTIFESWQSLHGEIVARGYTPNGPIRELYVRSEPAPQSDWVTELQQPVARSDPGQRLTEAGAAGISVGTPGIDGMSAPGPCGCGNAPMNAPRPSLGRLARSPTVRGSRQRRHPGCSARASRGPQADGTGVRAAVVAAPRLRCRLPHQRQPRNPAARSSASSRSC